MNRRSLPSSRLALRLKHLKLDNPVCMGTLNLKY